MSKLDSVECNAYLDNRRRVTFHHSRGVRLITIEALYTKDSGEGRIVLGVIVVFKCKATTDRWVECLKGSQATIICQFEILNCQNGGKRHNIYPPLSAFNLGCTSSLRHVFPILKGPNHVKDFVLLLENGNSQWCRGVHQSIDCGFLVKTFPFTLSTMD